MIDIERFSETARFVRAAVEASTHLQPPPNRLKGKRLGGLLGWERNVDITLTYYFGKFEGQDNNRPFPYEEVGKIFPGEDGPLTRQRIKQIVTETVGQLYSNCPTEVQAQYDLDILKTQIGKPKFITSEEGVIRSIAEDVEVGQKYEYFSERYLSGTLSAARRTLAPYGIVVPHPDNIENLNHLTEQFKKVRPKTGRKVLSQLLGGANHNFRQHRDIYDQYLIGLSKLLRDLGFHFHAGSGELNLFLERMNHFDIPFGHNVVPVKDGSHKGRLNYYFVFRTQEEEISQSLLSDANLAKFLHNPVVQLSGIEVNKVPNINDLAKREDFRHIIALCRQLRVKAGVKGVKVEDLLEDCPFPTFCYTTTGGKKLRRRYFYPVAYQEHLADFLLEQNKAKTA